ncbi:hypothetical protein CEXT_469811, partial [Caerostris extrusa]
MILVHPKLSLNMAQYKGLPPEGMYLEVYVPSIAIPFTVLSKTCVTIDSKKNIVQ